ncbi:MAG TPA: hypothetical protein VFE05_16510 [Longimicrobiaceae bacterium]|nr:hypothetical protein [Longimicrobiaceae bacterium]
MSADLREVGHAALSLARTVIEKKLKADPEQYGALLRSPLYPLYKLKASHLRIVYHVEKPSREVWILMIGNRRDIWNEESDEILRRMSVARVQIDASREATKPDHDKRASESRRKQR